MGREVDEVHPAMEKWLKFRGYRYIHHHHLGHGCITDFTIWRAGYLGVVECKKSGAGIENTIDQVLRYRDRIKDFGLEWYLATDRYPDWMPALDPEPIIAIPWRYKKIDFLAQDACLRIGIKFVWIDMSSSDE